MKIFLILITAIFALLIFAIPLYAQTAAEPEALCLRESGKRMHGRQVELLQKMLIYLGYEVGKAGADGWFGPDTEKALKQYQRDRQLAITGCIRAGDIITELAWQPQLHVWQNSQPPVKALKQTVVNIEHGQSRNLRTYYGEHTIQTVNESDEWYMDYTLSPSGRFLLCLFYSPWAEGGTYSIALICFDILTEKHYLMYAHWALELIESENQIDPAGVSFGDFYWTVNEEIFFNVNTAQTFDTNKKIGFIIKVKDF
ncbi:MAG: peptidoglycan-binding protein [Spirochaetales bacterium]|nr:peptidoglycan-binding protein [Spirochaetales bacterium]